MTTRAQAEGLLTERLDSAPEPCLDCGENVWADQGLEMFVDVREITGYEDFAVPGCCRGTQNPHKV